MNDSQTKSDASSSIAYIACTERSQTTLQCFETAMKENGLAYQVIQVTTNVILFKIRIERFHVKTLSVHHWRHVHWNRVHYFVTQVHNPKFIKALRKERGQKNCVVIYGRPNINHFSVVCTPQPSTSSAQMFSTRWPKYTRSLLSATSATSPNRIQWSIFNIVSNKMILYFLLFVTAYRCCRLGASNSNQYKGRILTKKARGPLKRVKSALISH